MPKNELIGKRFRSVIADCNCLFEVVATQGRGGFRCVVVNEPIEHNGVKYDGEFAGKIKLFTKAEVESGIASAEYFARNQREHEEFYAGLEIGSNVHYHHGGGTFVRCVVVAVEAPVRLDLGQEYPVGSKLLLPIALVGPWRDYDLQPNSYLVRKIREKSFMCPNVTNMFESPRFVGNPRNPVDPRALPSLDLVG